MSAFADRIVIANAPVSFGAFEITVGIDPAVPDGVAVLDAVQAAGYGGIDLGPVGYLGTGAALAERLAARNLGLAGGYLELPFSEPDRLAAMLPELDALLDTFDAVAGIGTLPPKPTLADQGSERRRANPGKSQDDPAWGLDDAGWDRFASGLEQVVERCRNRGYEPTFHNETGTFVEAPWEISRMLAMTSIGLCLDTGHLMLGGGDPLGGLRAWGPRINHLHIKDARVSVIADIVREAAPAVEIWRRGAFCALGTGDVDVEAVLAWVRDHFHGWLVVEQDILPDPAADPGRPAADQAANLRFLEARGFGESERQP
jgi:inosose dehydratase